jgi:hypothetical protein
MRPGSAWRPAWRLAAAMAATLGSLGIGAGLIVVSGLYNIGADDHHTALVIALIAQLRDRSIELRARAVAVPDLSGAAGIEAGARRAAGLLGHQTRDQDERHAGLGHEPRGPRPSGSWWRSSSGCRR